MMDRKIQNGTNEGCNIEDKQIGTKNRTLRKPGRSWKIEDQESLINLDIEAQEVR